MTGFIKNFVGDGEHIIYTTRLHWIYAAEGMLWLACMAGIGYAADYYLWKYFGSYALDERQEILMLVFGSGYPWIFWLFAGCGGFICLIHFVKLFATEIALTSQRLIFKSGLIFVNVNEIDLTEVRAEQVHHGLLGRFLGYGTLHLDSRFVGDVYLPAVRKPYILLKAIHAYRHKDKDPLDK